MMNKIREHADACRLIFILLFLLICMSCFAVTQPFGDGPDEINRYKVVSFIENHGTIPTGDNPEIILDGYGASYAFQPILTYMIEGYILFLLKPLGLSAFSKLLIARYVNIAFGLVAAFYTYRLSTLLFAKKDTSFLFTLAVVLLPQNIFIYTYVNTDGMGLLSCAMILFALIKGYRDNFDKESVITLSIGIILCLMSYYNCYGHVLAAFLAFIAYYIVNRELPKKEMWKKGGLIAAIVILGAGWWFIRNMIIYNGDIFALSARKACAAATGNEAFLAQMAETYQAMGYSVFEMVFGTDYYTLVWKSFIGMFGPMSIPISHHLYMAYKYLAIIGLIGLLIPRHSCALPNQKKSSSALIKLAMVICFVIPIILAIEYSYTWDFQPQGRYYLPLLLILAFILVSGLEHILDLISSFLKNKMTGKAGTLAGAFIYHIFYLFFFFSITLSIWMMFKYYGVL